MTKAGKNIAGAFLTGLLAMGLAAPLAAGVGREIKLAVRVFRIPKEQNFEAALSDGRGGTVKLQGYGSVTAAFPRATVFFPTELAANASEGAVAEAILGRLTFGTGVLSVKNINIEEIKSLELSFDKDHPKAEAKFEESRGEGRSSNYDVRAEVLSAEMGKVLVRLRFDAGWSAVGGSLGVGMSEDVVSAPFEIPEAKLLLVGGAASGTVYWLAVSSVGPTDKR